MKARFLLAPIALIAAILPQTAAAKVYAVILAVKIDDGGAVDVSVSKVVDPASGKTDAMPGVPVSAAFLKAARDAYVAKNGAKGGSGFTYYFMDTAAPDVLAPAPR